MHLRGRWGTTLQVSGAPLWRRSDTEWSARGGATHRQMPPVLCPEQTPLCAVSGHPRGAVPCSCTCRVLRQCSPGWHSGGPPAATLDACSHTWVATLPLPSPGFHYGNGARCGAKSTAFSNHPYLPTTPRPTVSHVQRARAQAQAGVGVKMPQSMEKCSSCVLAGV